MNIDTLEQNLHKLVVNPSPSTFLYDLLLAYEQPKASMTRLQKGDYNLAKRSNTVLWKKKVYFAYEIDNDLHTLIDNTKRDKAVTQHSPRFLIITDLKHFLAVDTKTQDTLDIALVDLPKHFDFFLPWAGMEKTQFQSENPADIKAAERMGRLYEIIHHDNLDFDRHALNIFLSRLLFCFFAEDTGIFKTGQFTNAIGSHTAEDGSDLQPYLQKLFRVLALQNRSELPTFLQAFPYVNGGLFEKYFPVPVFGSKSRNLILDCGTLNWKAINPDIFGSMIQAVVHDEQRSHMGMHYTSVVNIMKVIEPLFLNELAEELAKAAGNEGKLVKLLDRLYHLRIFDPACGSGNFLIIAYKELCKLEIAIFRELQGLNTKWKTAKSGIRLTQFYGIELDDFAHETAKLSLWLAEHQMNMAFREVFGDAKPTLPLQSGGNIVCGNATRLNWETVCPKDPAHETYILGNPPYLGARMQNAAQKADMKQNAGLFKGYSNLDYISCWFILAANYINNNKGKIAFISTSSITQGIQVSTLWPKLLENLEINFAHQSFKWKNNAKSNAGVSCVVIGIAKKTSSKKVIISNNTKYEVDNINSYLLNYKNIYIAESKSKINKLPLISYGSFALDDGRYTLSVNEKNDIVNTNSAAEKYIRKFLGAKEFIQGIDRYCIWIPDNEVQNALSIKSIFDRYNHVKKWRSNSDREATRKLTEKAYSFAEIRQPVSTYLVFPTVSSETREYIPTAFMDCSVIASNQLYVISGEEPFVFGVVSSMMHMIWVRAVAGRLETRIRYSSSLCYNTFPFPDISAKQKEKLEDHVFKVLDEREKHPEKTMAQLYDPDKMPEALRQAHHDMDIAIEQCYRVKPFTNDEERLEYLFTLYEEMIAKEKARG